METHKRSLVKTITWRIIGSTSASIIAYTITGSIEVSSAIGAIHLVINTILYWMHERFWNKLGWGKVNDYKR